MCGENVIWMAATRDHIIPVSKGGHPKRIQKSNHYNLALSHYLCNNLRGNYSIMKISLYIEYVKKHMGADMFSNIANESIALVDEFNNKGRLSKCQMVTHMASDLFHRPRIIGSNPIQFSN